MKSTINDLKIKLSKEINNTHDLFEKRMLDFKADIKTQSQTPDILE